MERKQISIPGLAGNRFRKLVFGDSSQLDSMTKLFLLGSFLVSVANAFGLASNLAMGFSGPIIWYGFGYGVLGFILFLYARKKKRASHAAGMSLLLITAIFIMLFWSQNCGFNGPMLIYFSILPLFASFFVPRRKAYVWLISGFLISCLFFGYYYFHSELITSYQDKSTQYFDNILSLLLVSWACLEIALYYKEELEASTRKALEHVELLTLQNQGLMEMEELRNSLFLGLSDKIKQPVEDAEGLYRALSGDAIPKEEKLAVIRKTSAKMAEAADHAQNIQAWTRAMIGPIPPQKTDFDLEMILDEILKSMEACFAVKNVMISKAIPEGCYAFGDISFFKLSVGNLLRIALHFSPVGGNIRIVVRGNSDHMLDFQIMDEGEGIEQEQLASLLSGNSVLSDSTLGLAFSVAKLYANWNGGELFGFSSPGLGNRLGISLRQY